MSLHAFVDALVTYCALTRGSVTSWGRTTLHNMNEGGVAYSGHRFWLAADVVYDEPPPPADRKELGRRLGLRVLPENDHDHLQPLTWEKS